MLIRLLPEFEDLPPRYRVVAEQQFLDDCKRLANQHPHFNDLLLWFEWLLERAPDNPLSHRFEKPYEHYYQISSGDIPEASPPTVIVIYRVEESTVTLWGLSIVDGD